MNKFKFRVAAVACCMTIAAAQASPYHMQSVWRTGNYPNIFVYYGASADDYVTRNRLQEQYNSLFKGGTDQTVMYAADADKSYILDVNSNDIRSEGMSYGMMIAVQMGDQETFDKLWNFARTYMQNSNKTLAWQLSASSPYSKLDSNSAPDGEEYMAMALYFAQYRVANYAWAQNYDYGAEAKAMLDALRTNLFDQTYKQILFSAAAPSNYRFTDPSYHLPAFYELWATLDPDNATFWTDAAAQSRVYQWGGAHGTTGLFSEYSTFRPGPTPVSNVEGAMTTELADGAGVGDAQVAAAPYFFSDAYRTIGNIGMDFAWFTGSCVAIPNENACPVAARLERTISERQLTFFAGRTDLNNSYISAYALDGTPRGSDWNYKSAGHVAMNAVGSIAAQSSWPTARNFVHALWNQNVPTGQYRYYDGMLHMLAMLHLSGRFRIYAPLSAGAIKIAQESASQMQLEYSVRNTDLSPQSNLRAYYYFTVENGKTPVVDDISTPNISSLALESLGNNQWAVRMTYSGLTLNAGQAVSQADYFRLRYSDGSAFNKSNDFSAPKPGDNESANRVGVFNGASKLVAGAKPKNVSAPAPTPYTIRVRARGTTGQEMVNLTVGGTVVASWRLTTSFANYDVSTPLRGGINVVYTNDGGTRDVVVDYAEIGGTRHQAEAQTSNTAAFGNGRCGGGQLTEWMHCNGYLGFSAYNQ